MIKLEAFEPFIAANSEMAAEGKFGVLVLTNSEWIPTEITEADFSLYAQVHPNNETPSDADTALFEAAFVLNSSGHSAWPLVELVEVV